VVAPDGYRPTRVVKNRRLIQSFDQFERLTIGSRNQQIRRSFEEPGGDAGHLFR
jgi:hypothetical protein